MDFLFPLHESCRKPDFSDYGFSKVAGLLSVFRNLISKTVPEAASLYEHIKCTVGNKRLQQKIPQMRNILF